MDSRLKQRLIGAFVIVLLAVIFVPYLVQEPVEPTNPVANTAIPPAPEPLSPGQSDLTISLPESTQPPESTVLTERSAPAENTELGLQPSITEADISELSPSQEAVEGTIEEVAETPNEQPIESTLPAEIAQPATPPTPTESNNPSPQVAAESSAPPQRPETPAQPQTPNLPQVNLLGRANNPPNERTNATPPPSPRAEQAPARSTPSQPSQQVTPRPQMATAAPAQGVTLPKVELIGRSMSSTSSASSAPARTASRPQTVSTATQTQRSVGGRWAVQVGSFSLQQNANNMRNRLSSRNFSSSVEPVQVSGQTMYRVRVGPYSSRNESEQALTRLRQAGISSGQVISLNN